MLKLLCIFKLRRGGSSRTVFLCSPFLFSPRDGGDVRKGRRLLSSKKEAPCYQQLFC